LEVYDLLSRKAVIHTSRNIGRVGLLAAVSRTMLEGPQWADRVGDDVPGFATLQRRLSRDPAAAEPRLIQTTPAHVDGVYSPPAAQPTLQPQKDV